MDKKQILAVILSVIIIVVGMTVQNVLFPSKPAQPAKTVASPSASASPASGQSAQAAAISVPESGKTNLEAPALVIVDPTKPFDAILPAGPDPVSSDKVRFENSLITALIDPKGANLVSMKLKKYQDDQIKKEAVEMLVPADDSGLVTRFGGKNGQLMDAGFFLEPQADPLVYRFYRDFQVNSKPGQTFKVTKTYTFFADEYVFQVEVGMQNSIQSYLPLDSVAGSYTIGIEPQIGPLSTKDNTQADNRRFVYLVGNDRKVETIGPGGIKESSDNFSWAAIDNKYFSFFFIPGAAKYSLTMANAPYGKSSTGSSLFLTRTGIQSDRISDKYVMYAGPKLSSILVKYNKQEDNKAGQNNLNLEKVVDWDWLGWLSETLKFVMQFFYWIIPNWGVSILLLTLLVKILLFPLTKKSMESSAKMQALNPKITELKEKLKDNPQKMNLEMAELYRKEKINPLGGCLPMLLQFPFFIAMYSLFSNHFDLRGASFIPGWIGDLSQPETVLYFNYSLFGLNISGLHLLPFIYLATQLLNGKFTQTSGVGQSNGQMKFMMYGLPIMFFFFLYEVPSGLLVYWTFQNILNIIQQIFTNKHLAKLKEKNSNVVPGKFEVVRDTKAIKGPKKKK